MFNFFKRQHEMYLDIKRINEILEHISSPQFFYQDSGVAFTASLSSSLSSQLKKCTNCSESKLKLRNFLCNLGWHKYGQFQKFGDYHNIGMPLRLPYTAMIKECKSCGKVKISILT